MTIEKTVANVEDVPPLRIYRDRLVFSGFGEPLREYSFSLAQILEEGDTHAALLWALFFKLSDIDQSLRALAVQGTRAQEQAMATLGQFDPVEIVEKLTKHLRPTSGSSSGGLANRGTRVVDGDPA